MDTTPITTAARRITHAVNADFSEHTSYFDTGGHRIGGRDADAAFIDRPDWMDAAAVCARGGIRITQREAQDRLDAHAFAVTATGECWGERDYRLAYDHHLTYTGRAGE